MKPHHAEFHPRSRGGHAGRLAAATSLLCVLMLVLGGCASFSADGGFGVIETAAKERLGKDLHWARTAQSGELAAQRVSELLAKPLTLDDAMQVALLNNRGLQASFDELGIAEADVVQAGRLPNPAFRFGRLKRGSEIEIELGFHFNLARLVAMPLATQIEARRFAQAQGLAVLAVSSLAAETRKAYFSAIGADESVRYMRQVMEAADAGAELARRMAGTGNWNKLQQAREHGFYAEAVLNLARAEQARTAARERLTRLLGLWGAQTA